MLYSKFRHLFSTSGFAWPLVILAVVALAILVGVAMPKFTNNLNNPRPEQTGEVNGQDSAAREATPVISAQAACEAKCRNDYGGSGSAGFDACIRACGAGGALREAACPVPGPACPSPQSPVCHDGRWYCRENVSAVAGLRVFPETNNAAELNYPTDAQLREGACGEPGLACEVPSIPDCRNGRWTCVPPAEGLR